MKNLKNIGIIVPVISGFLIICGYLKLHIFYSHFGIEIYQYLKIGEIILLFLPDTLKFLGMIVLNLLIAFILPNYIKGNSSSEDYSQLGFKERLKKYYKTIHPAHYLAIGILLFFITPYEYFPNILKLHAARYKFELIFFLIWPIFYVFAFVWSEVIIKYDSELNKNSKKLITFFSFGALLFLWGATSEAIKLIGYTETGKYTVSFEYQGKKIESSTNELYLGQTQNYLFMKNLDSKKTSVFERNEIRSLELIIRDTK